MAQDHLNPTKANVRMQWGVKVPLRDGVRLNATLYMPKGHGTPSPVIFTLTPYIAQTYHDIALYFAEHGYPFLAIDVRGRGNSEGVFMPLINEAADGHDVVEWIARQSYCNGKVTMWGGSYGGFVQWATAAEAPPHLATIVPVASPFIGVDFPMRANVPAPYLMQWLTLVSGSTSQDRIFFNGEAFWGAQFRHWFESGTPFKDLDTFLGNRSPVFQEWVCHPEQHDYWARYNPTSTAYSNLTLPILTITGSYDGNQPGALLHYRQHLKHASAKARAQHYLVMGPWDHAGTRVPQLQFCGLTVGPASLIDMRQLHLQWYAWTLQGGPRPEFLQKNVTYYVLGAEEWRYADSLEEVTSHVSCLYLQSNGNAADVFTSGSLTARMPLECEPDQYLYDPRDISHAALESTVDPANLTDQRMVHALSGKQLVYHSEPFERDIEVTGFFELSAWLSIDQPDTDFRASVYEIGINGESMLLSADWIRARYRESLREEKLISTLEPLRYDFAHFTFISRLIKRGHRLRLVVGPINSIYGQKNYNSGGVVSEESMQAARPVTVKLFHDPSHPSVLRIPIGQAER